MALHLLQHHAFGPALKHFGNETAAWFERGDREVQRQIRKQHDPHVIGRVMPGRVGRHV